MARILVAEDEADLLDGLRFALEAEGHEVIAASDGAQALARLDERAPDLAILDWMLPKRSGLEVLESIRREGRRIPVILLTARDGELDKVRGLDSGADDYVTKPFALAELLARVRAHLRRERRGAEDTEPLRIGEAEVDLERLTLTRGDQTLELSARQGDMLRLLWRERGKPVSRAAFLDEVWGHDRFPTTRTVDQHIAELRKKLEADPKRPRHLHTVFGIGYRLDP